MYMCSFAHAHVEVVFTGCVEHVYMHVYVQYEMGVYICLGQEIHEVKIDSAVDYRNLGNMAKNT